MTGVDALIAAITTQAQRPVSILRRGVRYQGIHGEPKQVQVPRDDSDALPQGCGGHHRQHVIVRYTAIPKCLQIFSELCHDGLDLLHRWSRELRAVLPNYTSHSDPSVRDG